MVYIKIGLKLIDIEFRIVYFVLLVIKIHLFSIYFITPIKTKAKSNTSANYILAILL